MMKDMDVSKAATARRVARLEALSRRMGQPLPDEEGIKTYCRQMALSEAIAAHRRNVLHKLSKEVKNDYTRRFNQRTGRPYG